MNTIDPLLRFRLEPIIRRRQRIRRAGQLALCWAILAIFALGLISLQRDSGWASAWSLPLLVVAGFVAALVILTRQARSEPDWREIARLIEARHPELKGLVLTAVEQEPKEGELTFLQDRLVQEAVRHSEKNDWAAIVPFRQLALARVANLAALALFVFTLTNLRPGASRPVVKNPFTQAWTQNGVTVSPGDTSIERGTTLVVMARFTGQLPNHVDLVVGPPDQAGQRVPLVKSLADPMFGGSVYEVASNLVYHVEYAGQRTRDFKVTVFEYPKLVRPDADVTYPEYTGLAPKRIENTRRVSAVEGSHLDLTLQLNKPVVSARLVARDNLTNSISLTVQSNVPVALLKQLPLDASHTYQLQLVDADGRTNKVPAQFVFDALKNRPPELKLALPRGDIRPSALEEVAFEGTAYDDFGVKEFGLGYTIAGQEPKFIELGSAVPAKEKRTFNYLLRLEDLALKPDDLVSYFVWADDVGPDGQLRRSTGDLFFAEVRPFEEVFRERQGGGGEGDQQDQQGGEQSGQQGQQGNRPERLADLQKQIISATWKLQQQQGRMARPAADSKSPKSSMNAPAPKAVTSALFSVSPLQVFAQRAPGARGGGQRGARGQANSPLTEAGSKPPSPEQFKEDTTVVKTAQEQARDQAQSSQEEADARTAALWDAAAKDMERAIERLDKAINSPESLAEALAAEQAAYQTLLRLQQRQYEVTRQRGQRGQRGQSSRQQQMQRQLDQLDLTQQQNRYETQNQARAPQNQSRERQEQLQNQNRLAELARRQQDLNDRMREMQTALQEARTEQERQEIQRQLKRLQEEQQQNVADADELAQRMERQQDQTRNAEQRQQLDQARQDMQRAADAAQQGNPSQALAAGTRAQRQMQEIRDQMRRENSSEFAEDLRQMRADARDLARRQQDVENQLNTLDDPRRRTLSDADERKDLLSQLGDQRQRLTNLVDRATQLSEQTEQSEPLASKELYDTLRKFTTDDANTIRQLRQMMLTNGVLTYAMDARLKQTEERAAGGRALDATSDLIRTDLLPQAQRAQSAARNGIEDFRQGIERAAEKVIGDDSEALRLAQEQLDQLANQLNREIAQATGRGTNELAQAQGSRGQRGSRGAQPGESGQPQDQQAEQGQGEPGAQPGDAQGQQLQATTGRQGQPGRSGQRGQRGQGSGEQAQNGEPQPGEGQQAQAEGQGQPGRGQGQRSDQQARGGGSGRGARGQPGENQQGDAQVAQQDGQPGGQPGAQPGENQPGQRGGRGARSGQLAQNNPGGPRQGGANRGGNNTGGANGAWDLNNFLDQGFNNSRPYDFTGPVITGNEYANWSDQLRAAEEMVDDPYLQNRMAQARERARLLRQDFTKNNQKPDWAVVKLQVVKPLVEVRDAIADELARRGPKDNLVPIDRDPVPTRYSELVRRYYEELGKEK